MTNIVLGMMSPVDGACKSEFTDVHRNLELSPGQSIVCFNSRKICQIIYLYEYTNNCDCIKRHLGHTLGIVPLHACGTILIYGPFMCGQLSRREEGANNH